MESILVLSSHVDYWDYIGWKDPFTKPINTRRQREYSRIFRKSFVYTPQMVIHGMVEVTGFNEAAIKARIQRAKLAPDIPIKLTREKSGLPVGVSRDKLRCGWFSLILFTTPKSGMVRIVG